MKTYPSIRYARARRYAMPVPEDAAEEAPLAVCPQRESRLGGVHGPSDPGNPMSEDCLRMTIHTPDPDGCNPVMVWLPGGAFVTGCGEFARYDGSRLCEEGGIVVVRISYRVGMLGYTNENGVNLSIEDQICALEWVRDHIRSFGGDPSRVTVCGQSAGAYSIACIVARGRTDLMRAAILFSAPLALKATAADADRLRGMMRQALSASNGPESTDALTHASWQQLIEAQEQVMGKLAKPMPFCPVNEPVFPCRGQQIKGLERVLLTCQSNDAQPFVSTRWMSRAMTWLVFRRPMRRYAAALRRAGVQVSTRVFRWHPENGEIGACHTMEVPFLLGNWDCWKDANMLTGLSRAEYETRGMEFRKEISDFVKKNPA